MSTTTQETTPQERTQQIRAALGGIMLASIGSATAPHDAYHTAGEALVHLLPPGAIVLVGDEAQAWLRQQP